MEIDPHDGPVLIVSGADLMEGTPILDIKPYIPYADSHPEATEGFRSGGWNRMLEVAFPPELLAKVPENQREALIGVLSNDPRPSYHHDPDRIYGLPFGAVEVKFSVNERLLKVVAVI